ncbi:hypothetical protein ACWGB8_01900 [Kitasatospora sp. NPDC054939]
MTETNLQLLIRCDHDDCTTQITTPDADTFAELRDHCPQHHSH